MREKRVDQVLTAIAWMRGQEQALSAILEEARFSEGGLAYVHIQYMADELGIRLSLDIQKILLKHQKRSRWPVERVRFWLSSSATSVVSVLFGFRINQLLRMHSSMGSTWRCTQEDAHLLSSLRARGLHKCQLPL
jgi:hypothetical protein